MSSSAHAHEYWPRIWAAIRLFHPFPTAIVVTVSGLLLAVVDRSDRGAVLLLRAAVMIGSSQVAVGALNDYLDAADDRLAQPDKPIPAGLISPAVALWLVAAGLAVHLPLAASFGAIPFLVALLGTGAGLAYDLWLKPTAASVLGYAVGFLSLVTWTWLVAGRWASVCWLVYPGGLLLVLAAHLAQSLPDIETDARLGNRGLAVVLGARRSLLVMLAAFCLAAAGGLILSTFTSRPGQYIVMLAILTAGLGMRAFLRAPGGRSARVRLFRWMAPAIGLLALGCLLAIDAAT